jgi:hypothetical protein
MKLCGFDRFLTRLFAMDMWRGYIIRCKNTGLIICVKVAEKVTFMTKRSLGLIGNNVEISHLCTHDVNR